jgi:hypothetical protein
MTRPAAKLAPAPRKQPATRDRTRSRKLKTVKPARPPSVAPLARRLRALDVAKSWLFDTRHETVGTVLALLELTDGKPGTKRHVVRARFGGELSPLWVEFPSREAAEGWVAHYFPYLLPEAPKPPAHVAVVITWR